jgi:serine/threonine protein kinase
MPRTVRQFAEDRTELRQGEGRSAIAGRPLAVPGYQLLQPLGAGTYGQVWLAEEERTGIRVAIKFLTHGTGLEWQLIQAEVKQLALLHADPGIVQLLDVDLEATPPYYVMAYAEQGSLARRLEKGPLPLAEALQVFRQLAEALAYVHAKGVRHCDLKPGNILLNARCRVLIADFGQAHLSTEASPALGTFFYMAPEQADLSRQIPDTRWDVYGLGAILYAMLTGHPPRESGAARAALAEAPDLGERLRRYREWVYKAPRVEGHRRLPGMDRRLAEIIDRCLEVDPERRLHDAGAVLAALARREQQHRQRPLLVFGFVVQVVLFLLMGGAAVWAAAGAVAKSEQALIAQLLESDRVNASLVANGLERDLVARRKVLERFAKDPQLRVTTARADKAKLKQLMQDFNRREAAPVLGWIVTDARGNLLATDLNFEPPPKEMPENFAWRDWFNGEGDDLGPGKGKKPYAPIRKTHFSQPFVRRSVPELAIGISTPIFAPGQQGAVVGVLYTPVRLHDIDSWLDRVQIKDGYAVLVDGRGHCLRHPNKQRILPGRDQNPQSWESPAFKAALEREGSMTEHVDPIDDRVYLVSFAPLPRVGWGALVQHERAAALRPIDDLRWQLLYVGLGLLLGVPLLLTGLWSFLIWTLRRKERITQG